MQCVTQNEKKYNYNRRIILLELITLRTRLARYYVGSSVKQFSAQQRCIIVWRMERRKVKELM